MIPKTPVNIVDTTPELLEQFADIARDQLFAIPPDDDWVLTAYTPSYTSQLTRGYTFFALETYDYLQDGPDGTPYKIVVEGHAQQGIASTQVVKWYRRYLYGQAPAIRDVPKIRVLE